MRDWCISPPPIGVQIVKHNRVVAYRKRPSLSTWPLRMLFVTPRTMPPNGTIFKCSQTGSVSKIADFSLLGGTGLQEKKDG